MNPLVNREFNSIFFTFFCLLGFVYNNNWLSQSESRDRLIFHLFGIKGIGIVGIMTKEPLHISYRPVYYDNRGTTSFIGESESV